MTDTTDNRPVLLVVGSGDQRYREYIVKSAAERYRLWLLDADPPAWHDQYVIGTTAVDPMVIEDGVAAAREIAAQQQIDGVFCYDEGLIWPSSHIAAALGVIGNDPEVVRSCRDKHATREVLDKAGVAQARSAAVSSPEEAAAAAESIGYPVVLKPRGLAGSKGVLRVDDPADLADAYTAARAASYPGVPVYDAGVLVEEYLDGPEISIDAVFHEGECLPMVLARKQVGFDPFFEEVGHVILPDDPLMSDPDIVDLLEESHRALGWTVGVTHTEMRLTSRGPRLIEVNARLGGDLIPWLGWLARGVDCAAAHADACMGRRPDVTPTRSKVAAIRFLYPPEDCEVVSIDHHPERGGPTIVHSIVMGRPGAVLRLPPRGYLARYGCVVAVADTEEECRAALAEAEQVVELHAVPVEATSQVAS
jgi:biotin carboxylase